MEGELATDPNTYLEPRVAWEKGANGERVVSFCESICSMMPKQTGREKRKTMQYF